MLGMAVSIGVTSVHVFTCKGFSIQRILPNSKWQEEAIPVLQSFFDDYMLPEMLLNRYKPSYYL